MTAAHYKWLVLFGCWLLYFIFGLATSSIAPLVPQITADLQLNASKMGSILGVWQFVYIFMALPVGLFLHRYGAGRMLLLAAALIALSGFLRSYAHTYATMLCAVAIFGIGGPIISAGLPQLAARWFTGSGRGLAMGVYITGPAVASVIALSSTHAVLLPWLEDWRAILRLWAWCAVLAGLVWFAIWMIGRQVRRPGEDDTAIHDDTPAHQEILQLLKSRNIRMLLLMAVGIFAIEHGLRSWMPEIIRAQGWTAVQAGYLATIPVILGVIGALTLPAWATPPRRIRILQFLFGLSAVGCLVLQTPSAAVQLTALVMIGLTMSTMITITLLTIIEQKEVSPRRAGLAGGLFFALAEIGGVSGPVIIGVLHDLTHSFAAALWVLSAIGVALLVLSQRLTGVTRP